MKKELIKPMTIEEAFLDMLNEFDDIKADLRKEWRYRLPKGELSDRLMTFELINRGYKKVQGGWV
ncbi:hypothetical protein LCGC14_0463590 [marine sediment metagenome]|uniref:Uncharacterized protein n=1 Tax=marine sediment metagenome TaxID=412755 RepID=A0A0F9V0Z2_9ZZZZ